MGCTLLERVCRTAMCECFVASSAAMKKVLSPISLATVMMPPFTKPTVKALEPCGKLIILGGFL